MATKKKDPNINPGSAVEADGYTVGESPKKGIRLDETVLTDAETRLDVASKKNGRKLPDESPDAPVKNHEVKIK